MRNSILILFFTIPALCFSQVIRTDYRNKDDEKCSESEANYILEYKLHSGDSSKFVKIKKTVNGRLVEKSELSGISPDIQEGESITFFEENGKTKSLGTYERNRRSGIWNYYYENGQLKEEADFDVPDGKDVGYRVWNYFDSQGHQQVIEGKGRYTENIGNIFFATRVDDDEKKGETSGDLTNGYKDGMWKGHFFDNGDTFEESWKRGKFIRGRRTDSLGLIIEYDKLYVMPEPEGGMGAFYQFVAETLRYPNEARRKNVQGKVFVQFGVDKNGRLINIEIVKGIGAGCDKEVLRVMKLATGWNAGYLRGKPVKIRMILPITFKLG